MNEHMLIIGFAVLIFNGFNGCMYKDMISARIISSICALSGFILILLSIR